MFRFPGLIALLLCVASNAQAQSPGPQSVATTSANDCNPQAIICISKDYQPAVGHSCLMCRPSSNNSPVPEAVKTLGVSISFLFFDDLRAMRLSAMKKVCAGDSCIYYRKTCDLKGACAYAYGNPGPWYGPGMVLVSQDHLVPGNMTIDYTTQAALQNAEQNIFFVLGPVGNKTLIPFTQLAPAMDSGDPYCEGNSKEPGCD